MRCEPATTWPWRIYKCQGCGRDIDPVEEEVFIDKELVEREERIVFYCKECVEKEVPDE